MSGSQGHHRSGGDGSPSELTHVALMMRHRQELQRRLAHPSSAGVSVTFLPSGAVMIDRSRVEPPRSSHGAPQPGQGSALREDEDDDSAEYCIVSCWKHDPLLAPAAMAVLTVLAVAPPGGNFSTPWACDSLAVLACLLFCMYMASKKMSRMVLRKARAALRSPSHRGRQLEVDRDFVLSNVETQLRFERWKCRGANRVLDVVYLGVQLGAHVNMCCTPACGMVHHVGVGTADAILGVKLGFGSRLSSYQHSRLSLLNIAVCLLVHGMFNSTQDQCLRVLPTTVVSPLDHVVGVSTSLLLLELCCPASVPHASWSLAMRMISSVIIRFMLTTNAATAGNFNPPGSWHFVWMGICAATYGMVAYPARLLVAYWHLQQFLRQLPQPAVVGN